MVDSKHSHINKRFLIYNKQDVICKVNENIETLLKYFKACYDHNEHLIYNEQMNDYIQSRLSNIRNLLASLFIHDELNNEEYKEFCERHEEMEDEFRKKKFNPQDRTLLLQMYVDMLLDLSIFGNEESDSDSDAMEDDEEDEHFTFKSPNDIPDNFSIYNVKNECKKQKDN